MKTIREGSGDVGASSRLRWGAALVGVVALAATLGAAERTALTWDEGDAFVRAERVSAWFRAVVEGPSALKTALKENEKDRESEESGENSNDGANGEVSAKENDATAPLNFAQNAPFEKKRGERRRLGDVERAALSYFARCDGRRSLFSEAALAIGWPHAIYREGHPAGYSLAIAAGRAFSLRFLPFLSEKAAFRFGPICLFAAALAAVFYRVGRYWGPFAAVLAVVGIATIPRVFGHAQLAGGDSLLISSWLLAWALFDSALATKRGAIAWGLAVGLSFCAKFSGFAVVLPFAAAFCAAFVVERRRRTGENGKTRENRRIGGWAALGRFALGLGVATAFFFAANPPLWARPWEGVKTFVLLNLRRDGFDLPIYFLGKIYSPSRPLPCWNGVFWLATTIPTALLAFAALGATTALPRRGGRRFFPFINKGAIRSGAGEEIERNGENVAEVKICREIGGGAAAFERRFAVATAAALGATLPLVRAIPGTPTHDGARLIIASFPFWGILAAVGASAFVDFCERAGVKSVKIGSATARRAALGVVAAAFSLGVVDLVRSAPRYLSFYNATLGGVVGATRRGMEPTYYWDAFDADAVAWLNAKIGEARADGRPDGVLFGSFSSQTLDYYRRWGTLATSEIATISAPNASANRSRFGFYVVQRRPTGLTPLDFALFKTARPLYRQTIRNPLENPFGDGGEVATLEIYDFADVERVLTGTRGEAAKKTPENR